MKKNIYILGELNIDIILSGNDIMPEWNKEKLVDSFDIVLGSSSAITATGLAGLGMNVFFVSVVGDDHFGHFCIEQLNKLGVDTRYVTMDPSLKTGVTLSLSTVKDRALLTYMGSIPHLSLKHIPEEMFTQAEHIHFGSYFLQDEMREHWTDLFKKAAKRSITTSFDTGWDLNGIWYPEKISELIEWTNLFIPSEDELMQIYGMEELENVIPKLPRKRDIVAIKKGSKGAVMVNAKGDILAAEPFVVTPLDTTGAGDSFNAGLIYSYLEQKDETEMLRFACACGALATLRIGGATAAPSVKEVEDFIHSQK